MGSEMELKRSAYHEAGHAVIGYRFGHRFAEISVVPNSKYNTGHCRFFFELDNPHSRCLVLLAGHAAQKAYDPDDMSDPSITDYREVWRLSDAMPVGTYPKLLSEAEHLVRENRNQIQGVAEALMECRVLDGGIFAVIIDCIDKGIDWRQSPEWVVHMQFHGNSMEGK